MNEEILLINKPKGITSFDVIRILRRKLGIKKMGHAGTLDPMATGLMIIGINKGTKKLNDYLKLDKSYHAEILIGTKTDSGDMEGKILEEKEVPDLTETEIKEVLKSMVGILTLPVPRFSAIKIKGRKLYEMARKEQEFEVPLREMNVMNAEFTSLNKEGNKYILKAKFDVGSGTYIRSLAEELGRRIGQPATLYNLVRTRIGEFSLDQAESLD